MDLPPALLTLADDQRGLLSCRQLRESGVSRSMLRWRLGRTWTLPLPGVVALFTGSLDPAQRLMAAQLWAGPGSQIAARELREPDAVRHLLVTATQQRLVRERDLRHELEAGPVRGSAVVRRALDDVATGAWSSPEVEVLRELAASPVLPRVGPNPVLVAHDGTRLPSPDFWLDDVGLAGQVHSRAYHLRDEQWEGTVEGDTLLGEYGIPVLAVTPSGFRRDPRGFRERVERAYLSRLRSGVRPDVDMVPRAAGVV